MVVELYSESGISEKCVRLIPESHSADMHLGLSLIECSKTWITHTVPCIKVNNYTEANFKEKR